MVVVDSIVALIMSLMALATLAIVISGWWRG